ncbi:MAG: Fe-S protein assembly chaperone HscA, partial [Neisseria animaloris]|nr:Fe-S protein assembly chaperone HscA [Neisseria animaloris]
ASDDMAARARAEAVVEAEGLIAAVAAALEMDGDLLSETELAAIRDSITALQNLVETGKADEIRNAVSALGHATDDFAAKRMDRNIKRALTGQRVEEI